jgi:hypothetical protein
MGNSGERGQGKPDGERGIEGESRATSAEAKLTMARATTERLRDGGTVAGAGWENGRTDANAWRGARGSGSLYEAWVRRVGCRAWAMVCGPWLSTQNARGGCGWRGLYEAGQLRGRGHGQLVGSAG